MAQKVKIITDSASDITVEMAEKYNISLLPLLVRFGEETYKDGVDLTNTEFYELLKSSSDMPKTAQVPIEFMEQEFRKSIAEYDHLVYVTIASAASGTFQTANLVVGKLEEEMGKKLNITILDSMGLAFYYGAVVREMAIVAQKGGNLAKVMKVFDNLMPKMQAYFYVSDLNYLQKGGRIKPGVALVGGLLGIKPLLTIKDGLVDMFGKERGSKRALEKITDMVANEADKSAEHIFIATADADASVADVEEALRRKMKIKNIEHVRIGATIGAHSGGGLVGIIFMKK